MFTSRSDTLFLIHRKTKLWALLTHLSHQTYQRIKGLLLSTQHFCVRHHFLRSVWFQFWALGFLRTFFIKECMVVTFRSETVQPAGDDNVHVVARLQPFHDNSTRSWGRWRHHSSRWHSATIPLLYWKHRSTSPARRKHSSFSTTKEFKRLKYKRIITSVNPLSWRVNNSSNYPPPRKKEKEGYCLFVCLCGSHWYEHHLPTRLP